MTPTLLDLEASVSAWAGESAAALEIVGVAEERLAAGDLTNGAWHDYLDTTGRPAFLRALGTREARGRWAETAFRAIRASNYSLKTMLERRAAANPDRILFEDRREPDTPSWSYAEVVRYAREIAGVLLAAEPAGPRVAILSENNIDGAVTDLACLGNGILVTPLNVHSDVDTLAWILDRLDINIAVTDSDERQSRLAEACARSGRRITLFRTGSCGSAATVRGLDSTPLRQACAQVDLATLDDLLASRGTDLVAPATVMFTSGSTGHAKGLVFSQLMLVAKRFARAAALPAVGDGEVLLCYLPLFHTFGRYLEMLGTVYWNGTYVFAGNPSSEALIAEMGRVRPTGLISIPLRWTQIRDLCLESGEGEENAFRRMVGARLRWGLSAAGYLDPKVFRFFHRHGVDLCSGFGMTEATGGITMTPPGEYVDGSVGVPLPGVSTRLTEEGELQISGIYVARYLDEEAPAGSLPALDPDAGEWISTGDLFRREGNGHLEIVDRIKDIYKNSRGQTVAPQRVEQRFTGVPGFRRTFLAGDHRDHNVLLIAPEREDPLLEGRSELEIHEYFAQIVASVNGGLAPYERVVNFALLERDFEEARGELTPKGSFRRKAIEAAFAGPIEKLYRSNHVDLALGGDVRVRIPRWFFRDLGILEDDIVAVDGAVENLRGRAFPGSVPARESAGHKRKLEIVRQADGTVRIGDLAYRVPGDLVDLGLFARQPKLWLGNLALAAFAPCKSGWDVSLREVGEQVRIPSRPSRPRDLAANDIEDERLRKIHELAAAALFFPAPQALVAIGYLGSELTRSDAATGSAIRRRLEALATRGEEEIRVLAYRTLLLDVPLIDYDTVFPSFLESGLSFLNEESIEIIATARRGERRLQSLRHRLYSYRTNLSWPAPPLRRRQFRKVFRMLAGYARHHRGDFPVIQAELAAWALFTPDLLLARDAQRLFDELAAWREETLTGDLLTRGALGERALPGMRETGKVVFEFGIAADERARLERILFDPTFLRHSIANAFNEEGFAWDRVAADGVWVSPMLSHQQLRLYRLGINLADGRHFDLLLIQGDFLRRRAVKDTILWLTALSGHALGTPTLPPFGAWRKDLGAASVVYVSDLTAWERIRELSSQFDVRSGLGTRAALRKLYVRAMAAFFHTWEQSGYRIVPGGITPSNVALPDADFHERVSILSLAGWRPYEGPLSLVRPMVRSFYRLAAAHYPQCRDALQLTWIFDACIEALGEEKATRFLDALEAALNRGEAGAENEALRAALDEYRRRHALEPHIPLPVVGAIDRYRDWERMNPAASAEAREEAVVQMVQLYRLGRFPDGFRYHVYARTFFAKGGKEIEAAFGRLVARRLSDAGALAGHLEELSILQGLLIDPGDRGVFSRMVFPHAQKTQKLELLALGGSEEKRVIVRSEVRDEAGGRYVVREPVNAVEIGHLYRLFVETDYPIHIAERDRQLVIVDMEERIVGGLSYRWQEAGVAYVDGIVVAGALTNQGLGGRLLEDFCVRQGAEGARLVKTNFFLGGLFTKHGFQVDERWGGLVRALG